jgi:glucose-6-phosphate isomerase
VLAALKAPGTQPRTAEEVAHAAGAPDDVETVYKLLEHLAANPGRRVQRSGPPGPDARFRMA